MRSPVRIWIAAPAQNTLKPSRLRGVFYFTLSVSLRSPAPPKGEPLAGRAALSGTPEVRYGAKGRALLQRSAASGQALIVKLPWISVAGRYRSRQAKLFSFSVGLTDTPVPLPLGEVSPKVTERASPFINQKGPLPLQQRACRVLSRSQQGPFHRPAQQPRASPHEWLLRSGPACR